MMKCKMFFEGRTLPTTSTSHPPDIIHMISVPSPSPILPSSASVYYKKIFKKDVGMACQKASSMMNESKGQLIGKAHP